MVDYWQVCLSWSWRPCSKMCRESGIKDIYIYSIKTSDTIWILLEMHHICIMWHVYVVICMLSANRSGRFKIIVPPNTEKMLILMLLLLLLERLQYQYQQLKTSLQLVVYKLFQRSPGQLPSISCPRPWSVLCCLATEAEGASGCE